MDRVAAVVVTYNRKQLLEKCLESVAAQTRPCDRILVIDNASTDGTADFLAELGLLGATTEYVRLPKNTGSAGGFHEGMRRAHEAGFDWLWLMDDDGRPAPNCLERLLNGAAGFDVIAPVVVPPGDPSRLTWKIRQARSGARFKTWRRIGSYEELVRHSSGGTFPGFAALFNGVLIHRRVPDAIGHVMPELFIWGDENEYLLRCKTAGFTVGMRLDAFHFHPHSRPRQSSGWKFYYLYRNTMYMYWRYGRFMVPGLLRRLYPLYVTLRLLPEIPSLSPAYLQVVLRGARLALRGRLVSFEHAG